MQILLIGHTGQLGWELERTLAPLGVVVPFDYPDIDLANPDQTRGVLRRLRPDLIVNAAAYTAVDAAESEAETAMAVNGRAPGLLAEEASSLGVPLVHYSTDYVFDGTKGEAYVETDEPRPLNVYGRTKLVGDKAVQEAGGAYLVLRTSWVYSLRRDSFVTKVLRWSREQTRLSIVDDQIGSPTWARMLAEITAQALGGQAPHLRESLFERRGVYHVAGSGSASRLEWAVAILNLDPRREEHSLLDVHGVPSSSFPTPATRPANSALDCRRFMSTFGLEIPRWETSLQQAMRAGGS